MKNGAASTAWAIDVHDGALLADEEAARERRVLRATYYGAWSFGLVVWTAYNAIYGSFNLAFFLVCAINLIGIAYGRVLFDPSLPRWLAVPALLIADMALLLAGRAVDQPGVNAFLLTTTIFVAFFLWRHRTLHILLCVLTVISYCALPFLIGGDDSLRRVVLAGPVFILITVLAYVFVRQAGKLQLERSTFHSTVASLLTALSARDSVARDHTTEIVHLAELVALDLGLGDDDREKVRYAAYLHDIGKLGVPNELLSAPGPLSAEDWDVVRNHPVIGQRIVASVPGFGEIARIVRHEHEAWNGRGFPDGLSGDTIPVESRIIHACDAAAALTARTPQAGAADRESAVCKLRDRAGTEFDPDVVASLVRVLEGRTELRLTGMVDLSLRLAG